MPPEDTEVTAWFAKEIQPHEPFLRSFLRGVARPSDVDDLVQESYTRLLRLREAGKMARSRGLLFTIARNAAHDLFRRRGRANTVPVAEAAIERVVDESPDAAETASLQGDVEVLLEAIDSLPERCRAVFLLRQFEGLSHREIAARLGIAEHTVESQLTKAMHRCQAYFEAAGDCGTTQP